MGYIPRPPTIDQQLLEQQQEYASQFNNSATAPVPGLTGPMNQTTQPGMQSTWNSLNGRLLGDTYLPPDASTVDVGNGWYEVHHGGQRVGTLRPGGDNGRFLNDTNWQMPQPPLVGGPPTAQPGGGRMAQPLQPMTANGPYGAQAMQMAGLLGQPQQPTTGLLGGPKNTFRFPGGK